MTLANRGFLVCVCAVMVVFGSFGVWAEQSHGDVEQAPDWVVDLAKQRKFRPCVSPLPQGMVCIPGGIYVRGSNRNSQHYGIKMRAESPRHYVILDTFYVDRYEVTHAQYRACLRAGACKPSVLNCDLPRWKRFCGANKAFVSATWWMARDYCRWAGKRLLTEAEWEAAARGPHGTMYPWGNSPPDCKKANYRLFPDNQGYPRPQSVMKFCPPPQYAGQEFVRIRKDEIWKVGSTTPNPFGIYDMAGNGYEWVQDFYDPDAYAGCDRPNSSCERINPKGPCAGKGDQCKQMERFFWRWKRIRVRSYSLERRRQTRRSYQWQWIRERVALRRPRSVVYRHRILKGGSWWWFADHLRSAFRRGNQPSTGIHRLSIRCGRSAPVPSR